MLRTIPISRRPSPRDFALDRAASRASIFRARRAESQYAVQLRKVARQIGDLVRGVFDPADPGTVSIISDALTRYAKTIEPWAGSVASRMLKEVSARDRRIWFDIANRMGVALRQEIESAPTGALMQQRLAEQVALITSLPVDAAVRVQQLAVEGLSDSSRASAIAQEIMRSGEVAKSRATLIARTEVGRSSTELSRARAEHIGSPGYYWRTAHDGDVRPEHRKLDGKFIRWDDPPIAGPGGERYHAGAGPNCRCVPEPVVPKKI